jgi:hypothetical protein
MVQLSRSRPAYAGNNFCREICEKYGVPKPFGDPYAKGLVYCTHCEEYMTKDALYINEHGIQLCKCCNCKARTKRRHSKPRDTDHAY